MCEVPIQIKSIGQRQMLFIKTKKIKNSKKKYTKKKIYKKKNTFLRTDRQTDGQPRTIVRNLTIRIEQFIVIKIKIN